VIVRHVIFQVEEFGVRGMREMKNGGSNIPVTDENKHEYVKLVCQMKMTGANPTAFFVFIVYIRWQFFRLDQTPVGRLPRGFLRVDSQTNDFHLQRAGT
jgi:hypothetical protein